MKKVVLEGERICLRFPTKSDAVSLYTYCRDIDISRFTFIPHPYEVEDAEEFIKSTHRAYRQDEGYHFAIVSHESGGVMGMIGLDAVNRVHRRAEIGYWLGKEFWGRGLMAEAIRLVVTYAFGRLDLVRVYAHVVPANRSSIRVLEKVGFTREGLLRQHLLMKGEFRDSYIFSILREEWKTDFTG